MTLRVESIADLLASDPAALEGHLTRYADFELVEEPDYWVVEISSEQGDQLRALAGELANFALGLTIEQRSS